MKSYRDSTGVFHRTQVEVKASGHPFDPVDIPTTHQELIDFINGLGLLRTPQTPAADDLVEQPYEQRIRAFTSTDYQNGDPTTVVMKSRDPMARFTCKACGVVNAPAGDR